MKFPRHPATLGRDVEVSPTLRTPWLVGLASIAMIALLWPYRGAVPVMDGWGFARGLVAWSRESGVALYGAAAWRYRRAGPK